MATAVAQFQLTTSDDPDDPDDPWRPRKTATGDLCPFWRPYLTFVHMLNVLVRRVQGRETSTIEEVLCR